MSLVVSLREARAQSNQRAQRYRQQAAALKNNRRRRAMGSPQAGGSTGGWSMPTRPR